MQKKPAKKIYFASDQHLGAPTPQFSFPREKKFVAWLDEIKGDAEAIFLLGDLFDFWFEYKTVVPKLNIPVFHDLKEFEFNNKKFLIGHGDGKGPGDLGYKRMKKVFTNPFFKRLFRWIHPDLGVKFGQYLSVKNKLISGEEDVKFLGAENEWLVKYAQRRLETQHYDFFVFGHRHLPLEIQISKTSKYINLGDWIGYFTYGVFDGETFELKKFQ